MFTKNDLKKLEEKLLSVPTKQEFEVYYNSSCEFLTQYESRFKVFEHAYI